MMKILEIVQAVASFFKDWRNTALAVLGVVIASLSIAIAVLNGKIEKLKLEKALIEQKYEMQNEIIHKQALDISHYESLKPQIVERIRTKYEQVKVKDDACEHELASVKGAVDAFFEH